MDRRFQTTLLNAVTQDWLRVDLYIVPPDHFQNRAQNTVKPLIDPTNIYANLPKSLPPSTPNPARVASISKEFLRVLGLLPVVLERGEYVTGLFGVGLQRDALQNLMLETCTQPDKGGALHLSKLLTPTQMQTLQNLPTPAANRADLIAAHQTIAAHFLPLAKSLHSDLNIPWPNAFETATKTHLQKALNLPL